MRAHKHLQTHAHTLNMSPSKFPLTCKMKGKHQIHRTTHEPLPSGPGFLLGGEENGGGEHGAETPPPGGRGWSCVIWLLQKGLRSQRGSWSV